MFFYQGEDIEIDLTITEDDTPVDIGTLDNLIVHFYQRNTNVKYVLNDISETFEDYLEVLDASNGEVRVQMKREVTSNLENRDLRLEVKIIVNEVDWTDSERHSIGNGVRIAEVKASKTGAEG